MQNERQQVSGMLSLKINNISFKDKEFSFKKTLIFKDREGTKLKKYTQIKKTITTSIAPKGNFSLNNISKESANKPKRLNKIQKLNEIIKTDEKQKNPANIKNSPIHNSIICSNLINNTMSPTKQTNKTSVIIPSLAENY